MESSTRRTADKKQNKEDILKEIDRLRAKLSPDALSSLRPSVSPPTSPKRKQPDSITLVPCSPSPKKCKVAQKPTRPKPSQKTLNQTSNTASSNNSTQHQFFKPGASNLLQNLTKASCLQQDDKTAIMRSSAFTERPPELRKHEDHIEQSLAHKRGDDLTILEDLEPGPIDHIPPADDPEFEKLEPNSGIRLSSRTVPHEDIQSHLTGRFYLSPSQLYSSIRLLPDKLSYDVPVPGDWITIAVVAERGPVMFSKGPATIITANGDEDKKGKRKDKGKAQAETAKPSGKKYVRLKLIDFGSRSRSASSATGGKAVIRGDAFLSLLLFEADSFDLISEDGFSKPRKMYKGGSRGAFESMSKLKEGDVIALLNPRILKPYQRANDKPHPETNILAITPESTSSIMNIGRARDLGMCTVLKRDNTVCGSWVDKRVSDVCDYHVQHAVERQRAGRAEFSIGTMGLSTSSAPKRKAAYDPARRWGLKPEPVAESATYIVSGHIVNDSNVDSRTLFATEHIGREGQAKAARQLSKKAADRTLQSLLERDKDGMKPVMKAREAGKQSMKDGARSAKDGNGKVKNKDPKGKGRDMGTARETEEVVQTTKNAYTAEMIKILGFDPIAMAGQRRGPGDSDIQKKLRSLEGLQSSRKKEIDLGPRPGQRIRSGVIAPSSKEIGNSKKDIEHKSRYLEAPQSPRMIGTGKDDLDCPVQEEEPMIDLDD